MSIFKDKSVLITGGTGTFGHAFSKRILKDYPDVARVIIYSRDEFKQFLMQGESAYQDKRIRFFIGDVRDKERLQRAFRGVNIVVHAAALKQILSCEYNPFEAIRTNVLGAQNVIESAIDEGVEKVVALSTDKACSPVNLYGATKLCSDKLILAGNVYVGRAKTRFSVVRYGNVAGSRGSVIPYFQSLIDEGSKFLPITDERMTRFWLKLESAVDLVLIALKSMQGGELFVKKIPSIKMVDLAKAIAPNLPIKIVGMKPGEKIHEMMISATDAPYTRELSNHFIIYPSVAHKTLGRRIKMVGKPVHKDFEYQSGNNTQWLSLAEIRALVKQINQK